MKEEIGRRRLSLGREKEVNIQRNGGEKEEGKTLTNPTHEKFLFKLLVRVVQETPKTI